MSEFRKKSNSTEKRAKNVNDAVKLALEELGVSEDKVTVEVIDEGAKGFLGLGARDAVVKVTVKEDNKAKKTEKAAPAAKPASKKVVSDEAPEEVAAKFLGDIFKAMELDVNIDAKEGEDNTVSIDISGDNMGIVIGKRGDTLDSLQYLTSLVVNKHSEDYIKVSIDTENYREKRTDALLALSKRLSEKVARTGKKFTLEPMNPYERRIIHSSLQDNEDVTTYSIGSEPYRKVVIAPKNPKPYTKKKNNNYKKNHENTKPAVNHEDDVVAENVGSYATTYKADFKPTQHKAEYKNFEDYLAAHNLDH
ncbi:MAG: RNA-binding cell elongation regulator Jag/EloR [Clostridia bacterium]|nr:RNA-binding cell elongation regulator Jag/EloR [Clostridia bacterium]